MPLDLPLETAYLPGLGLGRFLILPEVRLSCFFFELLQFNPFFSQVKDAS